MSKPSEVKAVAALLVEGAESPEQLAKMVIAALDSARANDRTFMVVAEYRHAVSTYLAYGPYPTRLQAQKAVAKGLPLGYPLHAVLVPTYSPAHAAEVWARVDAPPRAK